ncbi:MAG: hypothetical protein K0B15_02505 [Lentimicrobium sp.]|nr:hypothetical protein [Lentimicrobium sp.]
MTVFVNNLEIKVFRGARVMNAIKLYYSGIYEEIPKELPVIVDHYGNIIDFDGELLNLQRLYIIDPQVLNKADQYENP